MKPNYLWVLEIKEGNQWITTVYSALSQSDMMHIKKDFLYNNPDEIVRVRKYEAKAMKPRKPDRFERMANKFFEHGGPFYAVEVADLLRKEHAAVVRMVKANLALWAGPDARGNYINQYGRDCRAAQCVEILDQLKRRVK